MMIPDDKFRKLADAINALQMALLDCKLKPATSINVDTYTGTGLRAQSIYLGIYNIDERALQNTDYCGHVCGVPFYLEPRRGEQRHDVYHG